MLLTELYGEIREIRRIVQGVAGWITPDGKIFDIGNTTHSGSIAAVIEATTGWQERNNRWLVGNIELPADADGNPKLPWILHRTAIAAGYIRFIAGGKRGNINLQPYEFYAELIDQSIQTLKKKIIASKIPWEALWINDHSYTLQQFIRMLSVHP